MCSSGVLRSISVMGRFHGSSYQNLLIRLDVGYEGKSGSVRGMDLWLTDMRKALGAGAG